MSKIRTIVVQDAEVDDQNSLRHLLLYSNDIEIQGIIQTSSKFHYKGDEQHEPFRWTGTAWMNDVMDDYAVAYEHLKYHGDYPEADDLRNLIKIGNIDYVGEMSKKTEGSEWLVSKMLDDDPRPLYVQIWGGTNTLAKALKDIEDEYPEHKALVEKKVIVTSCGEQDETYRSYIAESYPNLMFVDCTQIGSYGYGWKTMPEYSGKRTFDNEFMKNIIDKGPLMNHYATWYDGKYYVGEEERSQFGSNKELLSNWWGSKYGLGTHEPYNFLSEGDSPTYFCLLPFGLRTLEDFSNGSLSGRFVKDQNERNSKNQLLNYYKPVDEDFVDENGNICKTESMWRYVETINDDFALRASWCVSDKQYSYPFIECDDEYLACADETLKIPIISNGKLSCRFYKEASTCDGVEIKNTDTGINVTVPSNAKSGNYIHIIVESCISAKYTLRKFKEIHIKII